jgi:hypothetical protein
MNDKIIAVIQDYQKTIQKRLIATYKELETADDYKVNMLCNSVERYKSDLKRYDDIIIQLKNKNTDISYIINYLTKGATQMKSEHFRKRLRDIRKGGE